MKRRFDPRLRMRRVKHPITGATGDDRNGAFVLAGPEGRNLFVLVSDGGGWDHVSVSLVNRALETPPSWAEMCWVKDQFFDPEEAVVQYHPPHSRYVNISETLHLWRPQTVAIPLPPMPLV
jgi:hypothetical protein